MAMGTLAPTFCLELQGQRWVTCSPALQDFPRLSAGLEIIRSYHSAAEPDQNATGKRVISVGGAEP